VSIFLSCGSNLGDRAANIELALQQLQIGGDVTVVRQSQLYQTSPIENVHQPDFINNVIEITTSLTADQLLTRIRTIEKLMNVYQKVNKGPRVIDIDILLYDDQCCTTDELTLPHPGICRRKFVLVPLLELAPAAASPVDRRPYSQYLAELDDPSQTVETYHG